MGERERADEVLLDRISKLKASCSQFILAFHSDRMDCSPIRQGHLGVRKIRGGANSMSLHTTAPGNAI